MCVRDPHSDVTSNVGDYQADDENLDGAHKRVIWPNSNNNPSYTCSAMAGFSVGSCRNPPPVPPWCQPNLQQVAHPKHRPPPRETCRTWPSFQLYVAADVSRLHFPSILGCNVAVAR